jgi:hypothetical protein
MFWCRPYFPGGFPRRLARQAATAPLRTLRGERLGEGGVPSTCTPSATPVRPSRCEACPCPLRRRPAAKPRYVVQPAVTARFPDDGDDARDLPWRVDRSGSGRRDTADGRCSALGDVAEAAVYLVNVHGVHVGVPVAADRHDAMVQHLALAPFLREGLLELAASFLSALSAPGRP